MGCNLRTKILYFQCFVTTDMFLFCKPLVFSGNCRIFKDLAFGSIKTRFEAILKKLDFSIQIYFLQLFGEICRPKMPKVSKLGLALNLKKCTSSFAPASQQRIKRLKPTNTRFKQQFDSFSFRESCGWPGPARPLTN